ncbi:MAG: HAMP domain-containing histidine kinase [Bacteroidales bacterium]|nr:HAMP domain-containing histidine kinase [Bacteroidales bacterium]MCF8454314.1 HAMP domain-containing histidine kinase [Bacteroidales bacterium]
MEDNYSKSGFSNGRQIRFIATLIVTLALGIVFEFIPLSSMYISNEMEEFQSTFLEKEKHLQYILNEAAADLTNESKNEWLLGSAPFIEEELAGQGFKIVLFESDKLIYWSDNSLQFEQLLTFPDLDNQLVFLGNSWCYVERKMSGPYELLGLMILKTEFPYENNLLKNSFAPGFNLHSSVLINPEEINTSFDVRNRAGEVVFQLSDLNHGIDSGQKPWSSVLFYSIALLILLLFLVHWFSKMYEKNRILIWLPAFILVLILLRFLLLKFEFPRVYYEFELFSPLYFGKSILFSSLGDFLLNSFFILILCYFLTRNDFFSPLVQKLGKLPRRAFVTGFLVVALVFFLFIDSLIESLIMNSTITYDLNKIFSITGYSIIGYIIISFLLFSFVLLLDKYLRKASSLVLFKEFLIIAASTFLGVFFISKLFFPDVSSYAFLFYLLFLLSTAIIRYRNWKLIYSTLILFLSIASLYTATRVTQTVCKKELEVKKVMAVSLATERDLLAESFIESFEEKLQNDSTIFDLLFSIDENKPQLLDYLKKEYFSGYWDKYDVQVFVCGAYDSIIVESPNEMLACRDFFDEMITRSGIALPGTGFYFLDNFNGRISYLGELNYINEADSNRLSLFFDLNSKLQRQVLGYPELLIEEDKNDNGPINDYSYAKYKDGILVTQSGEYSYSLSNSIYKISEDEFSTLELDDYEHLIYRIDENSLILVSNPTRSTLDSLILLSYIFVLFHIIFTLVMFFYRFPNQLMEFRFGFKNKIQISMISVLLLSLILVGASTIYFNIKQYNAKHNESISEKIQSVLVELEHKLGNEEKLNFDMQEYLTYYLVKFSNVFYTDINMYTLNGDLLASSRPEIFESNLIGTKMNTEAYRQVHLMQKANFVHKESIGGLEYLSAYVPFSNNHSQVLAYLNLPYFAKQKLMKKEISGLITAVVNIYVLLIILTIFVTILISNKITQPLRLIQEKMNKTRLGRPNEKILYQSRDEIGSLIDDYNRMMEELQASADKLAKSERESAWREMARQIAHEIKNPLTPMRLHIQHLQKAINEGATDMKDRIDKVATILISQIDALSAIATEFSNFANMPRAKNGRVDLLPVLEETAGLFNKEDAEISLDFDNLQEAIIFADKEQIQRVFINLIKNGIQAVPDGTPARIRICLSKQANSYIVEVKDNGSGVPGDVQDKLFSPNFTTKSSGMGLGLSIAKNTVETAGGKIWFETQAGMGSSFYVELPGMVV